MRSFALALLLAGLVTPSSASAQEAPAVSTSSSTMMPTDHRAQLAQLASKIDMMEGKILRAQEKVDVLRDTVLEGIVAKARSRIVHVNQMRGKFLLSKAV